MRPPTSDSGVGATCLAHLYILPRSTSFFLLCFGADRLDVMKFYSRPCVVTKQGRCRFEICRHAGAALHRREASLVRSCPLPLLPQTLVSMILL